MSEVKSINLTPGEMYLLNTNLTDKPVREVEFLQKVDEDEFDESQFISTKIVDTVKYYDVLPNPIKYTNSKYSNYSVTLIDVNPRMCPEGRTVEFRAVQAARTSYGANMKSIKDDNNLFDYLVRNQHTSPLEFVNFTFRVDCPIYVARQIMRHRTFSFNEYSLRYSSIKQEHDEIVDFRSPHICNKQSSTIKSFKDEVLTKMINDHYDETYAIYDLLIEADVCKEQARSIIPVGEMTTFYATVNLNNLFKFLRLRLDEHTQKETRVIAHMMSLGLQEVAPIAYNSFNKYMINSYTLTVDELRALLNDEEYKTDSKSSLHEFNKKKQDIMNKIK
jgi:thymidylate synthase (FAD)